MAKFLKFIVNTIMIVAIVAAASLLIPPFAGVTTLIVDDIEMETNLDAGSVTYAWGVSASELAVGDKVLLHEDGENVYVISAVNGSTFTMEDKLSTDGGSFDDELSGTIDKVIFTVPFLGYLSMALRTMEGLIIVGLSVVFVIILFILAEIWKKEEDDDEEETEDKTAEEEVAGPIIMVLASERQKEEMEASESAEEGKRESGFMREASSSLGADVSRIMKLEAEEQSDAGVADIEPKNADVQNVERKVKLANIKKQKVLAMPFYTKEELVERAKAAGDEPELVMDEISGVTFLDYSDIL